MASSKAMNDFFLPLKGFWSSIPVCVCVFHTYKAILRHQLGVLQVSSVLTLSTSDPTGQVLSPARLPQPHFRHQSQGQVITWPVILTNRLEIRVPVSPFLGLFNLLEGLTELRNILLARSPVYYKGYKGRDAQGKVPGRGLELPSLFQECHSPRPAAVCQPGSSLNTVLLGFYGVFIP